MTAPSRNTWDVPTQAVDAEDNLTVMSSATSEKNNPPPSANPEVATGLTKMPPDSLPRKGLSIGIKATVLAALFGVLPVLAVGIVAYRSADSSITERVAQQQLEEVDQTASQFRQYMQERIANINTVASIASTFPIFESDLGSEEKGRLEEELTDQLTAFVQDYGTYSSIGVFDLEGNVLVQSSGSALELNQGNAAYFKRVLQTGTAVVSEPVAIASEGDLNARLSIYIAAPIVGESGDVEAVTAAQIPLDFIGNSVLRAGISAEEEEEEAEFYYLADSAGNIMQSVPIDIDPEESVLGSPLSEEIPDFGAARDQKQLIAWLGTAAGEESMIAYAPVSGLGTLNWSVVASKTTEEAFEGQQQLLQTILLGTVITGMAAVLLGILLAKQATKPIEEAANTVELLGQGKLHARVSVRGNDELATLGTNVNRMAGQIQTLLQTLRQNAEQLGQQNEVLAGLAHNDALIQGDAQAAAQAYTEAIAVTLNVKQASIWIYKPEQELLLCTSRYDQGQPSVAEQQLPVAAVPAYFEAIAKDQTLAISNVRHHSAVQELVANGYIDSSTVSLLELPIQASGNFLGIVRCEQAGEPREWKPQEQTFVSSVANLVSLALESEVLQTEVSHLLEVVSEVEDGNLTTQAQVSDRTTGLVADTFNRLIERLVEVLQQAIETAQQVSEGANQQKSQASLIAANAEQQADGVNQVLQLTDRVQDLAQDAAHRVETIRASLQILQKTVEQGQGAITNLTTGIGILQDGSDRIIQQMKTLGEFVGLADQFVQDQNQIASLTQTLALNASLVAARAAEQRDPRQFAVAAREFSAIASQVSQLAQQTNASLNTLEQRSTQIQSVVFTVDTNVQQVGNLVEDFTRGVEQSNRVFEDVQTVTVEAVNAEAVVAQASQEIVSAVQSATEVVRNITNIATQTAEFTQNNRMQSEQMETLSQKLLQTMVFFQLPGAPAPKAPAALQEPKPAISDETTVII
ncbi:MAG: cache domain-containing protein [Cyanobacteria bacterium J06642_9]